MKIANNEKFKCFQPKAFLFYSYFFEENETVHVQPHLLYFDNNLSKNNNKKALEPTKPNKNLGFLCS